MDCKKINENSLYEILNNLRNFLFKKRMQSFQNLALATLSILAGILLQNNGYFVLELFFLVLCLSKLIKNMKILSYIEIDNKVSWL